MKKLIAINRFEFDGYAAREMMFETNDGNYLLVGSSMSPDGFVDEKIYSLDAVFKWFTASAPGIEFYN